MSRGPRRRLGIVLAAFFTVVAMTLLVRVVPASAEEATEVCRFDREVLPEISGMTYSQRHPGVLWVHNDSGSGPVVYAMDASTCRILATLTIEGIDARDLEAIASGRDRRGRPVLWLGDIGDNRDSWTEVRLHRIREPRVLRDRTVRATTYRFTYADRPHNAEALLADPQSTRVWVVTKQLARGRLYALPERMSSARVNVATPVRREGALITDGAVSPDGSRYVLRDYVDAEVFDGLPPGERSELVYLPIQVQGEAVTWTDDGGALLVASENDRRLLRVPLDSASVPSAAALSPSASVPAQSVTVPGDPAAPASPARSVDGAISADPSESPVGSLAGVGIAAALTGAAVALLVSVERRRRRAPDA